MVKQLAASLTNSDMAALSQDLIHEPPYFCAALIQNALITLDKTHYDIARKIRSLFHILMKHGSGNARNKTKDHDSLDLSSTL
jgi:hypothetical protein